MFTQFILPNPRGQKIKYTQVLTYAEASNWISWTHHKKRHCGWNSGSTEVKGSFAIDFSWVRIFTSLFISFPPDFPFSPPGHFSYCFSSLLPLNSFLTFIVPLLFFFPIRSFLFSMSYNLPSFLSLSTLHNFAMFQRSCQVSWHNAGLRLSPQQLVS